MILLWEDQGSKNRSGRPPRRRLGARREVAARSNGKIARMGGRAAKRRKSADQSAQAVLGGWAIRKRLVFLPEEKKWQQQVRSLSLSHPLQLFLIAASNHSHHQKIVKGLSTKTLKPHHHNQPNAPRQASDLSKLADLTTCLLKVQEIN